MKKIGSLVLFSLVLIVACKQNPKESLVISVNANSTTIDNAPEYEPKIEGIGQIVAINEKENKVELSKEYPYGLTVSFNTNGKKLIHASLLTNSTKPNLNLACESSWGKWYGNNSHFNTTKEGWSEMHLIIKVPDSLKQNTLKFYASFFGDNPVLVDSLKIELWDESPYGNQVPEYLFQPMLYEIVHQMDYNGLDFDKKNFIEKSLKLPDNIFEYFAVEKSTFKKICTKKGDKLFEENKEYALQFKTQNVDFEKKPSFENLLSGYTKKIVFNIGEQIQIELLNAANLAKMELLKPTKNYQFTFVKGIDKNTKIVDTKDLAVGVYCIRLTSTNKSIFNIPVILNNPKSLKTIVLAPITTWHAYNYYGGKSFYDNTKDSGFVYNISMHRPLVSCIFDSTYVGHDLFIFDNILQYFNNNGGCNVYPDYFLEQYPNLFESAKTIILAQHCEYASEKMYNKLNALKTTKNIISLGGNQLYWKVKFLNNYSEIECRKDGTYYTNDIKHGGNFRSVLASEASLLGVAYTELSYGTYDAYKVINPNHWMFEGTNVKEGDEFGETGLDGRGISGDELDFTNNFSPQNVVLLAKGINNNNNGGDFVIIENKQSAILSTGSIASGSGLGVDNVFTKMMSNFMGRYGR